MYAVCIYVSYSTSPTHDPAQISDFNNTKKRCSGYGVWRLRRLPHTLVNDSSYNFRFVIGPCLRVLCQLNYHVIAGSAAYTLDSSRIFVF